MPLFEYQCGSCQRTVEQLVLAGDTATAPHCPECGSGELKRLLSTFAAHHAAASGGSRQRADFDPSTACGGGACKMPDVCGPGGGGFD